MPFVKQRVVYLKRSKKYFDHIWCAVLVAHEDYAEFMAVKDLPSNNINDEEHFRSLIAECCGVGNTKDLALKSLQDQAYLMLKNHYSYHQSCLTAALSAKK